jgi:hypothetical protein
MFPRPTVPASLARALAAALALSVCGCDMVMNAILEEEAELPVKNEAGLRALAQQFDAAVQKRDFPAAYALCSSQLKARQSEEKFVSELSNQWALHSKGARPLRMEVELWMPYRDEFEEWEGMPKDLKYASLQGQVTLMVVMKEDEEGLTEGFDIDLFVVEDGGQPKIGYIEFYPYE